MNSHLIGKTKIRAEPGGQSRQKEGDEHNDHNTL